MKFKMIVSFLLFAFLSLAAQELTQTFLSLKNTGVEEFRKAYPKYDGRGTIVIVLDTGVDMGVPGLQKTTTGEVKVIDVQDFTGEGDIKLYEADTDEEDDTLYFVNEDMNYKVKGAGKMPLKPIDDNYLIGRVTEKLWQNSSAGTTDVNGNGTTDDVFYVVVYKSRIDSSDCWVAFFDTDADGDLSDEKPLRDYKINYDTFQIPNENGLPNFTFAVNIFPKEKRLSLFFDDGAHGTHCAGIAAGNKIGGNDFYGVAPGAKVIALKLGNNNFSGGATVTESMKKAYLYADKVSREREEPCIINMSFGIGSEIEGRAEMEEFLENLVKDNPYLYISTSNGNEGPGISTTGLPAATDAILSSGAVLAQEVGRDLYGAALDRDIILHFSSRGGEVVKPDVVSPGACVSTVPNWTNADRFWGTSMASPYSAGVMSLLLSAFKAEFPNVKIPSRLLYKALRKSATWQKDYTHLDQGGGLINVMNAYKLMKKWIKEGQIKKFETYTITAFAETMPNFEAPALYIRNGNFITGDETFSFRISRDNFIGKNNFYRIYKLKSEADWLQPIQRRTYIRKNQTATINVRFDKSKMQEPGLYNAEIKAYRADKTKFPEFDLMATVVIPYEFTRENNYEAKWEFKDLAPGMHKRLFIDIPAGATSMKIRLHAAENTYALAWYFLHAPDGRQIDINFIKSNKEENFSERYYYNLEPGVYELDVLGYYRAKDKSTFDVKVSFGGVNLLGDKTITPENNELKLVNRFPGIKVLNLSGKLLGYEQNYTVKLKDTDVYNLPFVFNENEASKSFEISISKEDFNKTTDFAVQIYDSKGKAVAKTGLSYKTETISIGNKSKNDTTHYRLELRPAFANAPEPMTIHIKVLTRFKKTHTVKVTANGTPRAVLYPSNVETIKLNIKKPNETYPKDSKLYGRIVLKNEDGKTEFEFPVYFTF